MINCPSETARGTQSGVVSSPGGRVGGGGVTVIVCLIPSLRLNATTVNISSFMSIAGPEWLVSSVLGSLSLMQRRGFGPPLIRIFYGREDFSLELKWVLTQPLTRHQHTHQPYQPTHLTPTHPPHSPKTLPDESIN